METYVQSEGVWGNIQVHVKYGGVGNYEGAQGNMEELCEMRMKEYCFT